MPGYPDRFSIESIDDLERSISIIRAREEFSEDIGVCLRMGVCPVGLISDFSREAWMLFNAIRDGAPWPWPGGWYSQPAVYAQAAKVFESEILLIGKEQESRRIQSGDIPRKS